MKITQKRILEWETRPETSKPEAVCVSLWRGILRHFQEIMSYSSNLINIQHPNERGIWITVLPRLKQPIFWPRSFLSAGYEFFGFPCQTISRHESCLSTNSPFCTWGHVKQHRGKWKKFHHLLVWRPKNLRIRICESRIRNCWKVFVMIVSRRMVEIKIVKRK